MPPRKTGHTKSSYLKKKYSLSAYKRKKRFKEAEELIIISAAVLCIILIVVFARMFIFTDRRINIPLERVAAFQIPYMILPEMKTLTDKYKLNFPELLTYYTLENSFFPVKTATSDIGELETHYILNYDELKRKYSKKNTNPYYDLFKNIFGEIKYFPIVNGYDNDGAVSYMYGDSWGAVRSYSGERSHKGTDILDRENVRGRIPVVSMTDGTITAIGWNELGGYRIGIETASGNYYYYAHFERFAEDLTQGSKVEAGRLLGYMGDTGYSKKEGTVGNFQTHLHIGISPATKLTNKEFWINPYPFLRYIESSKVEYTSVIY